MQPDNEKSLSDEATFAGRPRPQRADVSLGDERTLGDASSGQDTIIDDIEVVDLEARYRIDGTLGQGGMGAVLLATDTRLDRKVAIKRILGEAAGNRMAVNRFLTEAKSIAALNHPNIVQIYDYGRAKDGPFLIMEFVDGGSLLDSCRDGAMPLESAVGLACQLCDGLAKAHDLGIIHRDIKPANVLLTKDGTPKLTDFGLAKAQTGDHGQTMTGAVLGTPDFMPPEQRRDAALVDHRSDLWSLAATVYQMLTGRSPKVIRLHELPHALQGVLAKALEDEKEARYQSVRELRDAIKASLRAAGTAPAAVAAEVGQCPSCGVQNDISRKFCRGCGGSLEAPCLSCDKPMPMWEEICGSCGAKQTPLLEVRRAEIAAAQAKAEGLLGDFRFDEASRIATTLREEPNARLSHLKQWAEGFLQEVEKSRSHQVEQVATSLGEAAKHEEAFDYLSAIFTLESVPDVMRSVAIPGARETVPAVLERLKRKQAESRRLEALLKERIASKSVDGLLPDVEKFLKLHPDRQDVQKLRQQLLDRQNRQEIVRDDAVTTAKKHLSQHEYEAAVAALANVAAAAMTPEVSSLRSELEEVVGRVRGLAETIRSAVAGKQFEGLLGLVDEYLKLKPGEAQMIQLRKSLAVREEKIIAEIAARVEQAGKLEQACQFTEAVKAMESISEERRDGAARAILIRCRLAAAQRSRALQALAEATAGGYSEATWVAGDYRQMLADANLEDAAFSAAFSRVETAAEQEGRRARLRLICSYIAAAVVLAITLVSCGLWIRSSLRAASAASALAASRWDDVIAIDPRNVAAYEGRARERLARNPPNIEGAFADIDSAEKIVGGSTAVKLLRAEAHATRAVALARSDNLPEAALDLAEAVGLGADNATVASLRRILVDLWLAKATQSQVDQSSVGIRSACAEAKRYGATNEQLAALTAEAKIIDGLSNLRQEQYESALALFDAAVADNPSRNLNRERGLAALGLADQAIVKESPDKAALLLKMAVDCGVRNERTGKVAADIAGQLTQALKASPTAGALKAALAAYAVARSEADSAERMADLDDRVVELLQGLVQVFQKTHDDASFTMASNSIASFEVNGVAAAKIAVVKEGMHEAMLGHFSHLMAAGDLHRASSQVAKAREYEAASRKARHITGSIVPEESALIEKLLARVAQASEQGDGDEFTRCIDSLANLEFNESDCAKVTSALAALPEDTLRFVSPEHVAALPDAMLPLLPVEMLAKLSPVRLEAMPEDFVQNLPPEIQAELLPPAVDMAMIEPRFATAEKKQKPVDAGRIALLARLTDESLGTSESDMDRRLAINRRYIASHKVGGSGSVKIWPLTGDSSLGSPREIVSPHQTHGSATFGCSLFLWGNAMGVGSPNTWVSAPHDGRFYLFDAETGTRAEDFNPAPHAAQYFGFSVGCSNQGFFVVAEDGNAGHGSKAAFTFYKRPSLGRASNPLLRDVIGANATGYAISGSTVGVGGLVAAAPYRRANETGWTLQSWRATSGPEGGVKSVARGPHATGFPLMQGDQPYACSQCKTNGTRIALAQPAPNGGRVLLFDCSTPDSLAYLGGVEAPEDAGRDFAYSIAFAGDVLCIGAPNAPAQGGGQGAVYLLNTKTLKGTPRMRRVTLEATERNERFGLEIVTGDGLMAISAGKDVVYLFSLPQRMTDLAIP